ncbi:Dityrosine transporter 1 [Dipsacomyces acuminosporus]|nr:Dityrosine transporter 1 [Dipsacomyces acuminosporus]
MFIPSIQDVRDDLHTTQSGITWTITSYLITMAIVPLLWSNLSDYFGRKPIYAVSMLIYACGSIGCACSKSLPALIATRVIQSAGASAVQGAGAGTVSDIYPRHQRGTAMGIYNLGPLLGPCVGPLIGGYIGQLFGWRWVFWVLAILGGILCMLAVFVMPETQRRLVSKKHKIQDINIPPPFSFRNNNPIVDIATARYPVVALTLFYFAILFGTYSTNSNVQPLAYQNIYNLSQGMSGICYLAVGTGNIVGSVFGGRVTDLVLRAYKSKGSAAESGEAKLPSKAPAEIRLKAAWFGSAMFLGATIICGWLIDKHLSLAGILVTQFFIGVGLAFTFQCLSGYLIDVFPTRTARITGVQNCWRSVWAAVFVQLFPTMLDRVGWGWSYTIMFFLSLLGGVGMLLVWFKGEHLRMRFGPKPSSTL